MESEIKMVASAEVKLFGMWASPNVRRVEWALQMKGVDYEYIEEDLSNKSAALLNHNPVNKQVPVLVHAGRPIMESLVIIEYIDDTWRHKPPLLLPADPYQRASARFWATFAEGKCREATRTAFFGEGEERAMALEELEESLRRLDEELEGKRFFGGDEIGFTDLAAGWLAFWLGISEEAAGFKVMDAVKFPRLAAWMTEFLQVPVIRGNLPPRVKAVDFFQKFRLIQSPPAAAASISKYDPPIIINNNFFTKRRESLSWLDN